MPLPQNYLKLSKNRSIVHPHGAFFRALERTACVFNAFIVRLSCASYRQVKKHSGIKGLQNCKPFFHAKNQIEKGGTNHEKMLENMD
nr:MAG TPA: hypothetical protein [Caudoviricetes sp.]